MIYGVFINTAEKGEELVFVSDDRATAVAYEEDLRTALRVQDPDGTQIDCYTLSEEEVRRDLAEREFYKTLTEEQKQDIIEVDGRRFVRAIWERRQHDESAGGSSKEV